MSPYKIQTTTGDKTETANIIGSYGPTIVNGAMVYFVDDVFTQFVVDNADALFQAENKADRRAIPRNPDQTFSLSEDDLVNLGLLNEKNPLSNDFEGCFFQPNDAQLVDLASALGLDIGSNASFSDIKELIFAEDASQELKDIVQCAISSFAVPSSSLNIIDLDAACDNISENVPDLQTDCSSTRLSIGTGTWDSTGVVYANKITMRDASTKRVLLAITSEADVQGEEQGKTDKSTFFYQSSTGFAASDTIKNQVDGYSGALGLVPSVLVVALSVLCAFSL